jgi:hypothetical protein
MPVIKDERQISELLTRSVNRIYPTQNELKKALLSGKRAMKKVAIKRIPWIYHE